MLWKFICGHFESILHYSTSFQNLSTLFIALFLSTQMVVYDLSSIIAPQHSLFSFCENESLDNILVYTKNAFKNTVINCLENPYSTIFVYIY